MKKFHILPSTMLFAAAASLPAATYTYSTSDETNINWDDIEWSPAGTPGSGDTVNLEVNNSTESNVNITADSAEKLVELYGLYLKNYTALTLGDGIGEHQATLKILGDKLEIQNWGSLYINKNAALVMDNDKLLNFWNTSRAEGQTYREMLTVDGGTLKGHIRFNDGQGVEIVFKNGASFYRNRSDNPFENGGNQKSSKVIFDNSTYYGYNDWDGADANKGWKNNSFYYSFNGGSAASVEDTQVEVIFRNGAVLNGAGVEDSATKTAAYYQFDGDTNALMNGTAVSFAVGSLYKDTNYMKFSILEGSKVSASGFNMGAHWNSLGGYMQTTIKGEQGKTSYLATSGGTNFALSAKTDTDQSLNTFKNYIDVQGYSDILTKGNFSIGSNETIGGKGILTVTGDSNVFKTSEIQLNAGNNRDGSFAEIEFYFGKDAQGNTATNSSWAFTNFNAWSGGGNSKITATFAGDSNSINPSENFYVWNADFAGATSTNRLIFTDGFTMDTTKSIYMRSRMSGSISTEIRNGANISLTNIEMQSSSTGSTGNSTLIVDSATLKINDNLNYNNGNAVAGSSAVIIQGTGSNVTLKNLNINNSMVDASEHEYSFTMTGSDNTLTLNNFNFGNNATNSNRVLYFKGDSASNKNKILYNGGDIHMQGSITAGTMTTEFTLAGNTIFQKADGTGIILKINEYGGVNYLSGVNRFTVKGKGNEAHFENLVVGNIAATAGQGIFRVEGSGSTITVANEFRFRGIRDAGGKLTLATGKLELRLDTGGISAINLTGNNYEFNGFLEIDLSGLGRATVDQTGDGFEIFTLMTSPSGNLMSQLGNYWFDFDSGKEKTESVRVITQSSDDEYEFWVDGEDGNYKFNVYYKSAVPEPAAFAAVFGLAALAFATRRRRRN